MAITCFLYLGAHGQARSLLHDIKRYPQAILGESILDNLAWIFYAASMALIPISIATTISESYIALAVLVGVFINKEKLKPHQLLGSAAVILGALLLSLYAG